MVKSTSIAVLLLSTAAPFSLVVVALQKPIHTIKTFSVPGDNPLDFCHDPESYMLDIDYVDLAPNPPEAGKNLSIKASGSLNQDVEQGSKLTVKVQLLIAGSLIPIYSRDLDLCEELGKANEECPVEKGPVEISEDVLLPEEIPKGKFVAKADAYTKDGETISCMKAEVFF